MVSLHSPKWRESYRSHSEPSVLVTLRTTKRFYYEWFVGKMYFTRVVLLLYCYGKYSRRNVFRRLSVGLQRKNNNFNKTIPVRWSAKDDCILNSGTVFFFLLGSLRAADATVVLTAPDTCWFGVGRTIVIGGREQTRAGRIYRLYASERPTPESG